MLTSLKESVLLLDELGIQVDLVVLEVLCIQLRSLPDILGVRFSFKPQNPSVL